MRGTSRPKTRARADIDHEVVDRACRGQHHGRLTIGERRAIVQRLHGQGLYDTEIQALTGISDRTALRIRQELQLPAAVRDHISAGAA